MPAVLFAVLVFPSVAPAAEPCPNEALRSESNVNPATGRPYSAGLPDCRAYELVSSGQGDNNVMGPAGAGVYALASGDGDSLVWDTAATWPYGEPSNGAGDVLRAMRGTAGWSPPLTLAPEGVDGHENLRLAAASSDLSTVLLSTKVIALEGHSASGLLESGPGGCCATVAGDIPYEFGSSIVAQLSADGSHVFFQTKARLLSEDTHGPINSFGEPETHQVYEWTRAGGLRLAGLDSEGKATSPCGAELAAGGLQSGHDVSADGSRMFFQSPDPELRTGKFGPEECSLGPVVENRKLYVSDLYVRENGSTTVDISKPPPGVPDYGAEFVAATSDGSKVFFVSESALTPDKAHSGRGFADLYEYDVETGVLARISVGVGHEEASLYSEGQGGLADSAIVSADGSHVYFTALGQLVPGVGLTREQNENDCTAVSCPANLYLYANGRISFIANILPATQVGLSQEYESSKVEAPLRPFVAAVTPDGSDLIFESKSRLTAYENEGHGELYRYDMASSTIACVSCSPTGAPAEGVLNFHATGPTIQGAEETGTSIEQLGGLSGDGSTVFFTSSGQLLPAAVNAAEVEHRTGALSNVAVNDVYEWRDGVLSLISTGTSLSTDELLGASPSGSDVFFATEQALVPQDGEHSYQIYGARSGGGFPAPATPAPCVSLATCRSMVATPPVPVAPATVSVSGSGNVTSVSESPPPVPVKVKTESRSEKLSKALKSCKKLKKKAKRVECEKSAHEKFGPSHKAKRSSVTRKAK